MPSQLQLSVKSQNDVWLEISHDCWLAFRP